MQIIKEILCRLSIFASIFAGLFAFGGLMSGDAEKLVLGAILCSVFLFIWLKWIVGGSVDLTLGAISSLRKRVDDFSKRNDSK